MSDRYRGPLGWLRRWNADRRERRRLARETLVALAADDAAIMEALSRVLALQARLDERLAAIEAALGRGPRAEAAAGERPARAAPPAIATARDALLEPELDLVAHLAPALEPRIALEVGGRDGRVARTLLELGFALPALAADPADPAGRGRAVAPALVHVHAGPSALEALRGLGSLRPAVLIVDFRDGAPGAGVPALVAHARRNGAPWHLVVFRRSGEGGAAFYGGLSDSPEGSSGRIFFFADRARYEDARAFLDGAVPRARFVPGPAPASADRE